MAIKNLLVTFILMLVITYNSADAQDSLNFAEKQKTLCSNGGQIDMNICMLNEYKKIDAELNNVYRNLINVLKDPSGITQAQRSWIKYRDAECSNKVMQIGEGGSLIPYAQSACFINLTDERIKHLKWHLDQDCNGCPPRK